MSGRCRACNVKLNKQEMTRKEAETGRYVDLCNHCFRASDYEEIPVITNGDVDEVDDDDQPVQDLDGFVHPPWLDEDDD